MGRTALDRSALRESATGVGSELVSELTKTTHTHVYYCLLMFTANLP